MLRWCWVSFQCQGVLLIWIIVGQGPTGLAVGVGGSCLDIFIPRSGDIAISMASVLSSVYPFVCPSINIFVSA